MLKVLSVFHYNMVHPLFYGSFAFFMAIDLIIRKKMLIFAVIMECH